MRGSAAKLTPSESTSHHAQRDSDHKERLTATIIAVSQDPRSFGPNDWLVEEMYDQFEADPNSVGENWREFFADNFRPSSPSRQALRPDDAPVDEPQACAWDRELTELTGVRNIIATNMDESLHVPTATSVRSMSARLLEVNRQIMNEHLQRTRRGKISFTHLIGYVVLEAIRTVPNMASSYEERDGKRFVRHPHSIGLGLAVDVARDDGSRSLLVPCIKNADTLDFRGFWQEYDDVIRKVRTNKLTPDDFMGVSVTVTNPGTIGTEHSVPRLMKGQGLIVGVGAIGYPAEYHAADPRTLARIGVSKTFTVTSTYDHRVIQGAESGVFLAKIHDLLNGADGFYEQIYRSLDIPYEPVRFTPDVNAIDDQRELVEKHLKVQQLINMYRVRGHLIADLDPLHAHRVEAHPELDPVTYGLSIWDFEREFFTGGLGGKHRSTLNEILTTLRDAYCRQVGVEYMFIQNPEERNWIQDQVEGEVAQLSSEDQRWILSRLNAAEAFEHFLGARYVGQKRFGIEGAESAIPILETVLDEAGSSGIGDVVMGMAHRGRLNVLINILGKQYGELFAEFEGNLDASTPQGSGDVKYHKGHATRYRTKSGNEVEITLASNPSHLEAVDPVVEGMVRAKQDAIDWTNDPSDSSVAFPVLPVLVHGDAAFSGQGVVSETLNLSLLAGYRTGGTVHLIIDNQVGFTTNPDSARSSVYATDVAKAVMAPVFHVNGDDPESCVRVGKLAYAYRKRFAKDVVIHLVCYRRFGHNEGDEPSYTQPLMYDLIQQHRSVRKLYTEVLISRNDITLEQAEQSLSEYHDTLQRALDETRACAPSPTTLLPPPRVLRPERVVDTAVDGPRLDRIMRALMTFPDGFQLHPKLADVFAARRARYETGVVDWSLGEAFAYGTLLLGGHDVRLAGQDTRRGTFSHRHAVVVDRQTGDECYPLRGLANENDISPHGRAGRFFVYDSSLSEYAALGFEYGYSLAAPQSLVIWEAQFGDFANGAQIVIDQFLSSSRDKWEETSNLVLMLPHGYEGQGPEHSSARLERFLSLCANDNLRVVFPTTAAQHFHALRRQVHMSDRAPLIIMSPKSLLRSPNAYSPVSALTHGTFRHVICEDMAYPDGVERVVLCSGKIAFDAMAARDERGAGAAIVRIEQLYPWPHESVAEALTRYPRAREIVWLQEEPENMGAATHVVHHLNAQRVKLPVCVVARYPSGSPSTGTMAMHRLESDDLLRRTFPPPDSSDQ